MTSHAAICLCWLLIGLAGWTSATGQPSEALTLVTDESDLYGRLGNGPSFDPVVSADGTLLVFKTSAGNLVPGLTFAGSLVYRQRSNGRLGKIADSASDYAVSERGRYVAFIAQRRVKLFDLHSETTLDIAASANDQGIAVSGSGQVVFSSNEVDLLIPGAPSGSTALLLWDRSDGSFELLSADPSGMPVSAFAPGITGDGSAVAFLSNANGIVAGDANDLVDAFLWMEGAITRLSQPADESRFSRGVSEVHLNSAGTWAAFVSADTPALAPDLPVSDQPQVFVVELSTGALSPATLDGDGGFITGEAASPMVSADGEFLTFVEGGDSNPQIRRKLTLVPGTIETVSTRDGSDTPVDVFAHYTATAEGERIFMTSTDRFIVPGIDNDRLSKIYLRKMNSGSTTVESLGPPDVLLPAASRGVEPSIQVSASGRYVAGKWMTRETSGMFFPPIAWFDRDTGHRRYFALFPNVSEPASPRISPDGRFVGYVTFDPPTFSGTFNVVEVDANQLVFRDARVRTLSLATDAELILFESTANSFGVADDNGVSDVYGFRRSTAEYFMVSLSSAGAAGAAPSRLLRHTDDGRFVLFSSADNLAGTDVSGVEQVYLRDIVAGTTELVSLGFGGQPADSTGDVVDLSQDGRFMAFLSQDPFLVDPPLNGSNSQRAFLRDRETGTTSLISPETGGCRWVSASARGSRVAMICADSVYVYSRESGSLESVFSQGHVAAVWLREEDQLFIQVDPQLDGSLPGLPLDQQPGLGISFDQLVVLDLIELDTLFEDSFEPADGAALETR